MESPGKEPPFAVMALWNAEHRSFAVETYLKNNESPITVQRIFRRHFRLGRHDIVPDHRTIVRWVNHFRTTASSLKEESPGRPRSQRTPARVEEARQALIRSPARSPDLTTPDFFLWGYLKCQVFATRPQTLADLKERIREAL